MSRHLRVAIDATAIPTSPGGAGRYLIELVKNLAKRSDLELTVLTRRGDRERWVELCSGSTALIAGVAPDQRALRVIFGELALGIAARRVARDAQVFSARTTRCRSARGWPVWLPFTISRCWSILSGTTARRSLSSPTRYAAPRRRASGLVFVSEYTRERFAEHFEAHGRTFVIPHGIDHALFSPLEPREGADQLTLSRHLITEPYVLAVGTIEPRKNHAKLLEAMAKVFETHSKYSLVIAGAWGWAADEVDATMNRLRLGDRVKVLGYVGDEDLAALYRQAAVACYPSSEEGFGIPALEALACGTTLVTSASSAMAEFVSSAAITVGDPRDPQELALAIEHALTPDAERRQRGLEIAAAHTWQRCAAAHAEAFSAVATR